MRSNNSLYRNTHLTNLLLATFISLFLSFPASSLTVGVIYDNGGDRFNVLEIKQNFNRLFPDIPVEVIGFTADIYKTSITELLANGSGPDVIFWHGGERLMQYVRKGYVEKLDSLSEQYDWQQEFSAASLQTVSYKHSIYAVPISFYSWGIYYNKAVLSQFNIAPPLTWSEFVAACKILKQNGIEPIAIGSIEPWVLAGWFDYLNLRLNGLIFHQRLLHGEIPFTDQRVIRVFEHWAELINGNYFLSGHQRLEWDAAMPYLFRNLSAFTLIGNFFSTRIPLNTQPIIGFIPFPEITPENNGFEEAPTDIVFIRASSKNKADAKKFISYLAQADVQTSYNRFNGGFPSNINGQAPDTIFNQASLSLLRNAKGFSQYFDRDTNGSFSTPALQVFAEFMQGAGIQVTVKKLEDLRRTELLPSHP